MIGRVFTAIVYIFTISTFAHADEKWTQDPLASDVEWKELSGASQDGKRPLTIEQITQIEHRENPKTDKKTVWGMLNSTTYARNVNCMKAFGNARFCKCLGDTLPAFLTFKDYIVIVTSTVSQVNFTDMTAEEKLKLYNSTINAREKCVTSAIDH